MLVHHVPREILTQEEKYIVVTQTCIMFLPSEQCRYQNSLENLLHKVKRQYAHFSLHTNYFLLPQNTPEKKKQTISSLQ